MKNSRASRNRRRGYAAIPLLARRHRMTSAPAAYSRCSPVLGLRGFFLAVRLARGVSSSRMRRIFPLLVVLLSASCAMAKVPASAWETGTLKDLTSDSQSKLIGMNGMLVQAQFVITHYFVESATYIYEADLRLRAKAKRPPVTVNAPIKFALIGNDFYIQDEDGKEHKLMLVKKTLKSPVGANGEQNN